VFRKAKEGEPVNKARDVLEQGSIVLGFAGADPESEVDSSDSTYLHLGHVNLRTWDFAGVRLHFEGVDRRQDTLKLCVAIPEHADVEDPSQWLEEIQTRHELADRAFGLDHLDLKWSVTVYSIVDDRQLLLLDEMPARHVEVRALVPRACFWKGKETETARAPRPRGSVAADRPARGSAPRTAAQLALA
jgi:hypothetical protein